MTLIPLLVTLATAAGATAAPLTPEQAIGARRLSDLRFSPDGTRLAFVVTDPPRGTTRSSSVWVFDLGSRELGRLTRSSKSDSLPRWSPDGRTLAFVSDRDERPQIYLLSMSGGEGVRLTDIRSGVQAFEWSPDGRQIAFLAAEPKSDARERKERDKDDATVVDRDDRRTRLWLVDAASKQVRQLTSGPWEISELQWTPGGDRLVVLATDRPESDQHTKRIAAVTVADGAVAPIAAPRGPFGGLRVSPDGRAIAYVGSRVDGPSPHDLYLQPMDGGAPRNLTATLDRPVGNHVWRADGSLLAIAEVGFRSSLQRVTVSGRTDQAARLDVNPAEVAESASGVIAFAGQTMTGPMELWVMAPGGPAEKVSAFNDTLARAALVAPEFVRYRSFDGTGIEAALLTPRDAPPGARLPLVVLVHGGPTGRWADSFEPWGQALAARGYAVLYPNIRGSVGYGQRFVEMNRADWGGGDFKDVMAGVDWLIARGIADPERLGIGGWSYGGYMAEWAITQTTRFKAAVSGAGMANLMSEFGTERGPAYDEWFFGLPYEKPEGFLRSSPISYIRNARTPTLILQGEADVTDPLGQSQELYRALKRYGVETDFVVYPREGHGLREEKHLIDRLTRIIDWFDAHLKKPAITPSGR